MKKTRHFLLFFAFALSPFVSTFANIVPLIKQGIAIGITPNPSYVRAADFDAGSFIDGATCTMPLIFSFDANGSELTKEFSGCTGIRMVDIYITNGCNPIEQAKVRTYIEVQNNLNLPNIPFCPDASVTAGVICLDDPAPISNPNAVIYPMPVMIEWCGACGCFKARNIKCGLG